jgi:hypothetical protein
MVGDGAPLFNSLWPNGSLCIGHNEEGAKSRKIIGEEENEGMNENSEGAHITQMGHNKPEGQCLTQFPLIRKARVIWKEKPKGKMRDFQIY